MGKFWRKTTVFFLTLALLAMMPGAVPAFAAAPSVSIDPATQEVVAGDTFTIDVLVDAGDYSLKGCMVEVSYDSDVMTTTEAQVTGYDLLEGLEIGPTVEAGTVTYSLASATAVPAVSGTMMTIEFTVDEAATAGTYDLTISTEMRDEDNAEITPVTISDGTVTVALPVTTPTIALDEGWNFISVPKRMVAAKNTFGELLEEIYEEVEIAWSYDPETVDGWLPIGNSTPVVPLEGYWIKVTTAVDITLSYAEQGQTVPPSKVLTGDAWNAIGHSSTDNLTAGNTLVSIADSWSTLLGWDAEEQAYEDAIIYPGTSGNMVPGKGYWIWMRQDDTLSAISG